MNKRSYFVYGRGRRMQFPRRDESQGGGNSGASATGNSGENNSSGNYGTTTGSGESNTNNDGQGFDASTFWNDPAPEGSGSNDSGTTGTQGNGQQGQNGQQPQNLGTQLAQEIGGLNFGNAFSQDIADQLADGNYEGVNQALNQMQRQTVQQSLVMAARVMQQFGQGLMAQVEERINGSLGNRDNDAALLEAFPSAADPKVKPMIQNVFQQALKHTGGKRKEAIEMTRGMLKIFGQTSGQDFGFNNPPSSSTDYMTDGASSLVEELLGRS